MSQALGIQSAHALMLACMHANTSQDLCPSQCCLQVIGLAGVHEALSSTERTHG